MGFWEATYIIAYKATSTIWVSMHIIWIHLNFIFPSNFWVNIHHRFDSHLNGILWRNVYHIHQRNLFSIVDWFGWFIFQHYVFRFQLATIVKIRLIQSKEWDVNNDLYSRMQLPWFSREIQDIYNVNPNFLFGKSGICTFVTIACHAYSGHFILPYNIRNRPTYLNPYEQSHPDINSDIMTSLFISCDSYVPCCEMELQLSLRSPRILSWNTWFSDRKSQFSREIQDIYNVNPTLYYRIILEIKNET
jgi:hypothetical protein